MSLSIKQMTQDPWDTIENKFPVGSRHSGTVKNITPYGVFVELETGIGGMIHISDLSWIKRYNHPNEFTKVGDKIDIVILSIDKENRKPACPSRHDKSLDSQLLHDHLRERPRSDVL